MPVTPHYHIKITNGLIGLTVFLFLNACTKPGQQEVATVSGPKSFPAKGYLVPKDSIKEPTAVPVGPPEEMKVAKRTVPVISNKRRAGTPKIIVIKDLRKTTPGKDNVPLPKTVAAISKPFVTGPPEVVQAKEPFSKEQNPESFSSFGKLQGIKHLVIIALMQDKRGNIWIGNAGGATRYDGKTFAYFTKHEGLNGGSVRQIFEDKKGNLWFCTFAGVTRYDGTYFTYYSAQEGFSSEEIMCATEDKEGNILFGAHQQGLYKFDGSTFTHYTEKEGLDAQEIVAMLTDKNGDIWLGTQGKGLIKFDGKTFTHFVMDGLGDEVTINCFWQSRNGDLWIGTEETGLIRFDGKVFSQYTETEGLGNNSVYSILEDKEGNLWVGTFGDGVNKFDGQTFTHYTEKEGLSNHAVISAIEDKNGNLWFGTSGGGVNLYHGKTFTHLTQKDGLVNNVIKSLVEDKKGALWFGTNNGSLFSYDAHAGGSGKGGAFTYLDGIEKEIQVTQQGARCKNGDVWFAGYKSIIKYDGEHFFKYSKEQGLLGEAVVVSIFEDSKGNLWLANLDNVVRKFDGKKVFNYTQQQGLFEGLVRVISEDRHGNIWFCGEGLCKYDGKNFTHFTKKNGFNGDMISCVLEDREGNMWFGTNGAGVLKYDGNYFTSYTEKEGLSDNNITSLLQDKKGNIWLGARLGFNKLKTDISNGASGPTKPSVTFKRYSYEDGFFGVGCIANVICEARDGSIWMGCSDRVTIFHPEEDVLDTTAPNVQLTSVDLYYESVPWTQLFKKDTSFVLGNGVVVRDFKFDSLSKWYGLPENLNLAYNNNYLTFNFIGITQKQPGKVKYQYKLEGSDVNWSSLTNRNDVSYGNLDPGVYTFKLRALSGDGYWSKDFNYTFTIQPPFWRTWWFKVLLILVGLGLIFGFVQYRTRNFRKQERKLARIVVERTTELENKTVELEQSNRDKDRIMKMLVHDLRNPLSGIRRISSMLIDQDGPPKQKEMLGLIHNSSTSLFGMVDALIEATLKNHKEGVKLAETNMGLLLNRSVDALLFKANEKKQEIILNTEDDVFAFVDPQKTERVLNNLISNAIKFSSENSSIIVRLFKNKESVQISVEDHGIGIPDELRDKVFDMFTKAKRRGTAGEEPFGLGLSICKQIVDAHGGRIWFESESGKGTTFYLELPLLQN